MDDKLKNQIRELETELEKIDRRANAMAESVVDDPSIRWDLSDEAEQLSDRLLDLSDELKECSPATFDLWDMRISESILDLDFVQTETEIVSLRTNQLLIKKRQRDEQKPQGH